MVISVELLSKCIFVLTKENESPLVVKPRLRSPSFSMYARLISGSRQASSTIEDVYWSGTGRVYG